MAVIAGASSGALRGTRQVAIAPSVESIEAQVSSDPDCPPHMAAAVSPAGMARLEFSATKAIEKSWVRKAASRVKRAMAVSSAAPVRALRALSARAFAPRRRPSIPLSVA